MKSDVIKLYEMSEDLGRNGVQTSTWCLIREPCSGRMILHEDRWLEPPAGYDDPIQGYTDRVEFPEAALVHLIDALLHYREKYGIRSLRKV